MKKIFTLFAVFLTFAVFSAKAELTPSVAEEFIKKVTSDGIEQIINSNVSQEQKDARFEKLFNSSLDLDFIGRFVLGRYWNTATPSQRKEFINVYRRMNIKTWSKRFDEFKGKNFIFNGTSPSNSQNQIFAIISVPMKSLTP